LSNFISHSIAAAEDKLLISAYFFVLYHIYRLIDASAIIHGDFVQ